MPGHMWRSEDNLQDSVLLPHVRSGEGSNGIFSSRVASAFICEPSLAPILLVFDGMCIMNSGFEEVRDNL